MAYPMARALHFPLFLCIFALFSGLGCKTNSDQATTPVNPLANLPVEKNPSGLVIVQGNTSQGSEPRHAPITMLILHHTAGSLASSYDVLQGRLPHHQVGIHYLVTDEPQPRVIRMVPEDREAFHAGHSAWRNLESLNQYSIGIEIVNLDGNVHPYPAAQKEVVLKLCEDILKRNPGIKPTEVLAHSDIAVGRKIDPGSFFPWASFALHQVGVWPLNSDVQSFLRTAPTASPEEMRQMLEQYGYHLEATEAGLKMGIEAFQRHFRPTKVDGIADAETVATLRALLKRYPPSPLPATFKTASKSKV